MVAEEPLLPPGPRGEAALASNDQVHDANGAAPSNEAGADGEKKKKEEEPKVRMRELYRFVDSTDKLLLTLGTMGAVLNGCAMPGFSYLFGKLVNQLADHPGDMDYWAMWMVVAGAAVFVAAGTQMAAFTATGERQADRIRCAYLAALLRQEPGWHDGEKVGMLTTRLHGDTHVIHAGIGEKVGMAVSNGAMVFFAYVVGFISSWRLTLIILSTSPLIAMGGAVMQYSMTKLSDISRAAYGEAGAVAEEVLSSVRTVYAFNAQENSIERYSTHLEDAKKAGIRKGFAQGAGIGLVTFIMFGTYGIAFYYASWLVQWGLNDTGDILTCFFSVLMGSFAMGQVASPLAAMSSARAAAHKVFRVIDRQPVVASGSRRLQSLRGDIELRDISFRYPTRQEHWVFRGLDLRIGAGQAVALVGPSGCGKSSVVSMLQRFYDPEEGCVYVDGVPLSELDLEWWRDQVGVVTQEPVLFSGTIAENVRLGLGTADWQPGDDIPPDVMQRIEKACKDAQIHDIIMHRFPDGYATKVGEGGGKLSGGQKQRVAIARAIVKDPRILLLDEATSALDRRHEAEVQRALNQAMKERTTVIVAHRLTTVRHADNIVVIKASARRHSSVVRAESSDLVREPSMGAAPEKSWSRIAEQGTHDQLLQRGGLYAQLYKAQLSGRNRSEVLVSEEQGRGDPDASPEASPGPSPMAASPTSGEKPAAEDAAKKKSGGSITRVARMSRPWAGWAVLGVFGAFINGMVYPGYSIVFSKIINIFSKNPEDAREKALVWALLFVALGAASFIGYILEFGCFGICGENLTVRLRRDLFTHMLRQDLAFYDKPGRESGSLAAALAGKAEVIYKLFGPAIGVAFRTISTLAVGFGIAFFVSWELTLVILASVPVMAAAGYGNMKMYGGEGFEDSGEEGGEAGRISSEALLNIKTVIAFNCQHFFQQEFDRHVGHRAQRLLKKAALVGLLFGFSQFVMFGAFGLALWYGGRMIDNGRMPSSDPLDLHSEPFGGVMLVTMAVVLSAMGVGETAGMQGSGMDANEASRDVFAILDTQPEIDQMADGRDDGGVTKGALEFHSVTFAFPTRKDVTVLNGIDIAMAPGHSTALIGDTGCGKSTIIQLLLRFYDPASGAITVDGTDIRSLNLRYWRDRIGLVSQEPVLFSGTVEENIKLGRPNATREEVIEAATRAKVHDFITRMPDGYSTLVGQKGSQLSGGQKQRVAIARALIKRPRVLLLDEATSALDNVSEREVQGALDDIIRHGGMTTVEIAHRMTTIEAADSIAVIAAGQVAEQGSHGELMKLDGEYKSRYDLYHSLE